MKQNAAWKAPVVQSCKRWDVAECKPAKILITVTFRTHSSSLGAVWGTRSMHTCICGEVEEKWKKEWLWGWGGGVIKAFTVGKIMGWPTVTPVLQRATFVFHLLILRIIQSIWSWSVCERRGVKQLDHSLSASRDCYHSPSIQRQKQRRTKRQKLQRTEASAVHTAQQVYWLR